MVARQIVMTKCNVFLLLLITFSTSAQIVDFSFESSEQEARFRELAEQLRCLVCQNQSLADSNADLAQDLRVELYEQVINGKSEEHILGFMMARYGEFILYKPQLSVNTVLLWFIPFILLLAGIFSLVRFSRLRSEAELAQPSEQQLKRIRELLDGEMQKK